MYSTQELGGSLTLLLARTGAGLRSKARLLSRLLQGAVEPGVAPAASSTRNLVPPAVGSWTAVSVRHPAVAALSTFGRSSPLFANGLVWAGQGQALRTCAPLCSSVLLRELASSTQVGNSSVQKISPAGVHACIQPSYVLQGRNSKEQAEAPGNDGRQQQFGRRKESSSLQPSQLPAGEGVESEKTDETGHKQATGEPDPGQQEQQKSSPPPRPKQQDHAMSDAMVIAGYFAATGLLTLLLKSAVISSGMELNLAEAALLAGFLAYCIMGPVMAGAFVIQGVWLLLARCSRLVMNLLKRG